MTLVHAKTLRLTTGGRGGLNITEGVERAGQERMRGGQAVSHTNMAVDTRPLDPPVGTATTTLSR